MKIHVVGLHHTIPDERFSHCAFTGKVLRLPKVLPDYELIEYSNGQSQSGAKQVRIFSERQLTKHFGKKLLTHLTAENNADWQHRADFISRVGNQIARRIKPGDIVAHVCGPEAQFVAAFPEALHIETGIGYSAGPQGCYRIFESEAWRAWHMGKWHVPNNGSGGTWPHYPQLVCTAVVPNYYDTRDWALGEGTALGEAPYVLFAGRMTSDKGIEIVNHLALEYPKLRVKVVSGEPRSDRLSAPNIEWLGCVSSRADLAALYGGALCTLVPSRFWEPFGGVAVESLLTGTPVLAPDYAAFVETVAHPDDGLRCYTWEDYRIALGMVLNPEEGWGSLAGREQRRERAQARFGIEPVSVMYRAALGHFQRLHAQGIKP